MIDRLKAVQYLRRWDRLWAVGGVIFLSIPAAAGAIGCQGGAATVCGVSIPFTDATAVGDSVTVHVPASVLGDSYSANSNLHFTARCDGNAYDGAAYRIIDADKISCNSFPCPSSSVRLCDTSIDIPGGTPLGGVVQMNMPPPFGKNSFTVQCVGSGDNPPVYQISDHANVTCARLPTSQ
jgi:hypothetical protein